MSHRFFYHVYILIWKIITKNEGRGITFVTDTSIVLLNLLSCGTVENALQEGEQVPDSSIVNISLPTIARAFGVPLSGAVEWVIIAYLVVVAAALLTTGRLANMIGRKPIWAVGLALFTLGSAGCGGAPSPGLLIAARALQGFGGAFLLAISPAMLMVLIRFLFIRSGSLVDETALNAALIAALVGNFLGRDIRIALRTLELSGGSFAKLSSRSITPER